MIIATAVLSGTALWQNSYIVVDGVQIQSLEIADGQAAVSKDLHEQGVTMADPKLDTRFVTYDVNMSETEGSLFDMIRDRIEHKEFDAEITATVDTEALAEYIEEENKKAEPSADSYINSREEIVPAIYGTVIDTDAVLADVDAGKSGIKLENYYIPPKVTEKDLQPSIDWLNQLRNWTCTYDNGTVISVPAENVTITRDGEVSVDTSFIRDALDPVVYDYYTIGEPIDFKTHSGNIVQLSSRYWGAYVIRDSEAEVLAEALEKGESLTDRRPVVGGYYGDPGDTYVEVCISSQHCWVWIDGKVYMETDCVTGMRGKDTPTGIYYILEKVPGKTLVGEDYETWVNRWMRLTWMGVGLHDAYWRGRFGGTIYKNSGSHGCVNLPPRFAYKLYDLSYIGMPCAIYY